MKATSLPEYSSKIVQNDSLVCFKKKKEVLSAYFWGRGWAGLNYWKWHMELIQ